VVHRAAGVVAPLDLMEQATIAAAEDSATGAAILGRIDSIQVVNVLAGASADPAGDLGDRLGIDCRDLLTTTIGGNTPQWLLNRCCDDIAAGRLDAALIVGAEALASRRRSSRSDPPPPLTGRVIGDTRAGLGPAELAAGVAAPSQLYPWFESTLASRAGRSPDEQRAHLGRLMAPFTDVAAANPYAWFRESATPEELSAIGPTNRLVGEPYTKRLNAMIQVDQGAALLVMSAETARAAGVPLDRWVHPWSGADLSDVFLPVGRPDLSRSPAIATAGGAALRAADLDVDAIATFDLYSCFPCAVQIAAEALGIDPFDARGLTVTGGHPYFGGPGNNYVTHAIAATVARCRNEPDAIGLVTGLGWYLTKHSVGLYGSKVPARGWRHPDLSAEQRRIDATAVPVAGPDAAGTGVVDAMTVLHDRSGEPYAAPIVATMDDGPRVAAVAADAELARSLSGTSLVGRPVAIRPGADNGAPRYEPQ
jgi:acetyl-CoA C-acetyltransferase